MENGVGGEKDVTPCLYGHSQEETRRQAPRQDAPFSTLRTLSALHPALRAKNNLELFLSVSIGQKHRTLGFLLMGAPRIYHELAGFKENTQECKVRERGPHVPGAHPRLPRPERSGARLEAWTTLGLKSPSGLKRKPYTMELMLQRTRLSRAGFAFPAVPGGLLVTISARPRLSLCWAH